MVGICPTLGINFILRVLPWGVRCKKKCACLTDGTWRVPHSSKNKFDKNKTFDAKLDLTVLMLTCTVGNLRLRKCYLLNELSWKISLAEGGKELSIANFCKEDRQHVETEMSIPYTVIYQIAKFWKYLKKLVLKRKHLYLD
jgi:hypothetical protein